MYGRFLQNSIKEQFFKGKAIIIVGARQTGKTTLSEMLIRESGCSDQLAAFNGDDPSDKELLAGKNLEFLKKLIGDKKIVFIDEAQKITEIGQTIKLLVDYYKDNKHVLVTGSSSINLLSSVQEALTGRKFVHTLFALSVEEIYAGGDLLSLLKDLESVLIYGTYPEIVTGNSFAVKRDLLKELTDSYLFKDILEFQKIRNFEVIRSLVKALSLQIGNEVSYHELSSLLGIDKNTVRSYIDLLEKNFIVFRLSPYARNKRKEISKLRKIYFYDLGVRNMVINNLSFLNDRNDVEAL